MICKKARTVDACDEDQCYHRDKHDKHVECGGGCPHIDHRRTRKAVCEEVVCACGGKLYELEGWKLQCVKCDKIYNYDERGNLK